jgi:hypothetical protein
MLYMVTFTINILQMLAYIPYMDPICKSPSKHIQTIEKALESYGKH